MFYESKEKQMELNQNRKPEKSLIQKPKKEKFDEEKLLPEIKINVEKYQIQQLNIKLTLFIFLVFHVYGLI